MCGYHFNANWSIFAHAPSLQLCTTEFSCVFSSWCGNFRSVPDHEKLFKLPQIFFMSAQLCWLSAPNCFKCFEHLFQTGEELKNARKRKNSCFFDFESGSRIIRLLAVVGSDSNDIFSSNLIKLHKFVKFRVICIICLDFRRLWIFKNLQNLPIF